MQTIVRAADAAEFLALVPELFGFQPTNSMAVIAFRGKRTCGALRFDLPTSVPDRQLKRFLSQQLGTMCKIPGIDGVLAVVYTDEPFGTETTPPFSALLAAFRNRAVHMGLVVKETLCVASDGWASALDPDTPLGGHPLTEIPDVTLGFPGVCRPTGDQHGEADRVPPDLARVERVGTANGRLTRLLDGLNDAQAPCGVGGAREVEAAEVYRRDIAALEPLIVPTLLFEHALAVGANGLSAEEVALVLIALRGPDIRDVALMQWAYGADYGQVALRGADTLAAARALGVDQELIEAAAAIEVDDPEASCLDGVAESARRMSGEGPRPDHSRISRAIALLLDVVDAAPRSARPAPLTVLSWFNWAVGRNTRADDCARGALAIEPGYGLAGLMITMLEHGRFPEWLFERPEHDEGSVDV